MTRKKIKAFNQATLDDLARSGLDEKDAKLMGIEDVDSEWCEEYLGIPHGGYKIPYYDIKGELIDSPEFFRVRFTQYFSQPVSGKEKRMKDEIRYANPEGARPYAYFSKRMKWQSIFADPVQIITFTEGEKKAEKACKEGISCIGLGGVWNFKSTGRGWQLLPELEKVDWKDRTVHICYDSDVMTKREVQSALMALTEQLVDRGAKVFRISLEPSPSEKKLGLDDLLVSRGIVGYRAIQPEEAQLSRSFQILNNRICYLTSPGAWYDFEQREIIKYERHAYHLTAPIAKVSKPQGVGKNKTFIEVPAFDTWMQSPKRRDARNLCYEPGNARTIIDNKVNVWLAPEIQPKRANIKRWQMLIDHVFGRGPERDWFMKWLAYPIQYPGTKLYQAVFVWSAQTAVGKSFVITPLMEHIYGDTNFARITNTTLENKFNEELSQKQFVLFDECYVPAKYSRQGLTTKLKDMITREKFTVDGKYKCPIVLRDCANYYITSNHEEAVPLDMKDRRFLVIAAPNEKFPYASDLNAWLRDVDDPKKPGPGVSAILHHLRYQVDCSDFDPMGPALVTEAREGVIEVSRTSLEEFAYRLSTYGLYAEHESVNAPIVNIEDLHRLFRLFYPNSGETTTALLSRALAPYIDKGLLLKKEVFDSKCGRKYTFYCHHHKDLYEKLSGQEWLITFGKSHGERFALTH